VTRGRERLPRAPGAVIIPAPHAADPPAFPPPARGTAAAAGVAPVTAVPARVAVIGTGRWGRNLVRNFHALGALAALCDRDAAVLGDLAARFPVRAFSEGEAVFADPDVDAVAIATPSRSHGPLVRAALQADKAVFVEKPLCMSLVEAGELRRLAQARGQVLMVGHLLLYHPAFVALREFVLDGGIGALRYIYSNRLNFRGHGGEDNALWDFAPHDVSMILALVGELPLRVVSSGGSAVHPQLADTLLAHMSFAGDLQAHVFASWVHPFKDQRLVVVGEGGMVVFDDVLPGPKKLLCYPHAVDWSNGVPTVNRAEARPIAYHNAEPLALECQHFLDCVASGHDPRSDADEGWRVLAVLDAFERSLASGQPAFPGA